MPPNVLVDGYRREHATTWHTIKLEKYFTMRVLAYRSKKSVCFATWNSWNCKSLIKWSCLPSRQNFIIGLLPWTSENRNEFICPHFHHHHHHHHRHHHHRHHYHYHLWIICWLVAKNRQVMMKDHQWIINHQESTLNSTHSATSN